MTKYNIDRSNPKCLRYWDKNGTEILEGSKIKRDSGKIEEVHRTDYGELGTDATNPLWIKMGRAVSCEFGIYPFEFDELGELEVCE